MATTLDSAAPAHPNSAGIAPSATRAVQRMRDGFDSGRTRPIQWRRAQLHALRRLLIENRVALRDALHADLHKSATESDLT